MEDLTKLNDCPTITIVIDGPSAKKLVETEFYLLKQDVLPSLLGIKNEDIKKLEFAWNYKDPDGNKLPAILFGGKTVRYLRENN